MRDEHDGLIEIVCERADHIHHVGFGFGVEIAGRLVGEYDFRSRHEGSRYADALLLTARHLRRIMPHAFAKAHTPEHGSGDRFALLFGHAPEHQRHRHVFDGIEIRQQIVGLEHETEVFLPEFRQLPFIEAGDRHATDAHAAFRRFFHARQLIEQC